MKSFLDRLAELKAELRPVLQSRMVFLINPKETKTLEAVVAWTVQPKRDLDGIEVEDNATMRDLWKIADPDMFAYSTALGVPVKDAIKRLAQLQSLDIIYPDGSVAELAMNLVNVYIKNQVGKLMPKEKD